jgi:two-component system sensor histidine kinase/response regulator
MTERKTILLVDDTPDNITLLKGLLKDSYKTKIATNGEKALKIALSDTPPDLILLDIMMPGMDGYEVCERLKADENTTDIPVIFLTAKAQMEDEKKGLELGAVDYITKPISPPIVTARVKTHLRLKEAKDVLKQQNALLKENIQLRGDVERITRHDLKTPLNPILAYPKLMKGNENLTEKQIKYLNTIESSGRKMLNMINMSLDLYKMEQGVYEVKPEEVNLIEVFNEIREETKTRLKVNRLTVDTLINGEPAGETDQFIFQGEKLLLYSMLANLFKNAVEASPKNERITIEMKHAENYSVSIHNKGDVPEEIRATFFDKYATAGKSGGTGLGTYSARLIAETLGGKISLDTSEANKTIIQILFPG